MTRRRRSRRALEALAREEGAAPETPVDPDVARFATRTREQQAAQRDRKQAAREARLQAEEHHRLLAAKDAAAEEVKRLRAREQATADETAAADATYRGALADLIAFETGSPPPWAASVGSGEEGALAEQSGDGSNAEGGGGAPQEAG